MIANKINAQNGTSSLLDGAFKISSTFENERERFLTSCDITISLFSEISLVLAYRLSVFSLATCFFFSASFTNPEGAGSVLSFAEEIVFEFSAVLDGVETISDAASMGIEVSVFFAASTFALFAGLEFLFLLTSFREPRST